MKELAEIDDKLKPGYEQGWKLVRDGIHKGSVEKYDISEPKVLDEDEFRVALANKVVEEATEVREAMRASTRMRSQENLENVLEEMSDLMTVLHDWLDLERIPWQRLEAKRFWKENKNGKYKLRHWVRSVRREEAQV